MFGAVARSRLLPIFLLASGFSALLFQTAWMREYRLIFGATTAASGVVLGVFMAGLGLGNALLGNFIERRSRPMLWYGIFEVLIALSVAISPWLMTALHGVYLQLGGQSTLGTSGATVVRILLSLLVMGIPATLMGGTLPAAVRSGTSQTDRRRTRAALIYSANTLGSVAGVLATTFVLLEVWGTRLTLVLGCTINLLIGTLAILLGRSESLPTEEVATTSEQPAAGGRMSAPQWGLMACSALFGFGFFLMEIVWFRMLSPILGGTTFAFGVILAVVLLGIGLGSSLYAACGRFVRPTWLLLAVTSGLEALFLVWPYVRGDELALATAVDMVREGRTFGGLISVWMQTSFAVVFGASLCSGFQFPLMIALMGEARERIGSQVGWLFAANTLGAITGSLAGGLGLLPLLTAPGCWKLVVLLLAGLSLVIVSLGRSGGVWGRIASAAIPVCAVAGLFAAGPTAVWRHSGIGARRVSLPGSGANARRAWEHAQRRSVLSEAEGVEASLAIQAADGASFVVNGKSDGHAVIDVGTQIGLGLVGALSRSSPRECLVVGLGTGETAGWLAEQEGVERVTVVELEPKVDEIARLCAPINKDVLHHPRVVRVYNDAREALMTGTGPLDLVVSEPSNPYRAGIATLYTREFYGAVRGRLRPEGVFCQWLQGYEIDQETIDIVLATLRSVFANVQVWRTEVPDLVFVCSNEPIRYDADRLLRRIQSPPMREGILRAWRSTTLDGVFARYLANPEFVDRHLAERAVPINTDDKTVLEYRLAKTLGDRSDFPLETFCQSARRAGADLPAEMRGRLPELDEERLSLFYNQSGLLLEPDTTRSDADRKSRAAALTLALQGDSRGAMMAWGKQSAPPATYAERTLLGLAAVETEDPLGDRAAAELRPDYPADAAMLRAVGEIRSGRSREGLEGAFAALELLRKEPWGHPLLIRKLLEGMADLGPGLDESQRRSVFDQLGTPLCCHVADERRRAVRYVYAELLDADAVVRCLGELEPNVPWSEGVLRLRRDVYRSQKHPLSGRAERDWQQFRQQAKSGE